MCYAPFFNIKQIGVCFGADDLERASSTRPLVDIGSELVIIRPRLVREVKVLGSLSRSDRSIECRVVTKNNYLVDQKLRDVSIKFN
jgi:hypothetical protein